MFKLPALKPYGEPKERSARLNPTLEAPEDFRPSTRKQTWSSGSRSKRSDPDASYNPPIKTRTWENQADDVMSDGATTEKFRSLAVYADIKLQEALEKCNEITPAHVREENAPDRFRSACCLQILGELCMFVGPFEHTLMRIRDELAASIYSDYYTSDGGNLAFDQTPWFIVVEKLEAEKKVLIADREKFTAALLQHQESMRSVEAQMLFFQKKVTDLEAAAEKANSDLEISREREKKTSLEAQGAKEELKRARKDIIRVKDEYAAFTENSGQSLKDAEEELEGMKLRMQHMKREAEDAELRFKKTEQLQAGLVDISIVEAAEKKISVLELELAKYQERADEVRLERIKEIMTPRVNWKALDPFGEGAPAPGTSSKDIIKRMVKRLKRMDDGMPSRQEVDALKEAAAQLEDAQATADTALALLAPEPPMVALNWLQLTRQPQDTSPPIVRVKGFGKGPEIPRFLRSDGEISFPEMSVGEAEAQVAALWRAKRESDGLNGRLLHVADFMYAWARKVAGSPEPDRAVHAAYRLLVSCSGHAETSPQIKLFMEVLSGRVGEAAMEDMTACVGGVAKLLRMLAGLGRGRGTFELTEEATDLITKEDFVSAIENFFPAKHEEKVKQLLEAAEKDNASSDESDDRLKLAPLLETAGETSSNFLRVLQEQYIEDVVAYSGQVKAAVKSLMPKGGASDPNEVDMGNGGLRNALATVDNGFSDKDVSNMLATGAGLAFGSLADSVAEGGGRVDGAVFTARLQGMLVRPSKLWDTDSAMAWCAELRDGSAPDRGSASLGAQPDMA